MRFVQKGLSTTGFIDKVCTAVSKFDEIFFKFFYDILFTGTCAFTRARNHSNVIDVTDIFREATIF